MHVQAASGLKVPKENNPMDYITDAESVDVDESAYYLRRIADGDLLVVEPVTAKVKKEAVNG